MTRRTLRSTVPAVAARLGNYELIRKIGSGGMAEVWMGRRATETGATKAVAIKLMARRFADQPAYERMFAAEARLSMLLNHSNIVQVFDVGRVDETAFLVMEWVDGLNLAQILAFYRKRGERLPVQVAGYVVGEVLRALDYAHTLVHEGEPLRIVHRDVSPQNVLVSLSGEVKLTDFGVARLAMDETSGVHVKGKLRYMPREQLAGQSQHPGVDLYAVGAILHEMLSGEKFRAGANTELELAAMAASTEIPALPHADVPWELEELRVALLQPDPRHRVQSAAEALRMLERWPDYRNVAASLAGICRRIMGVAAPRSGLFDVRDLPPASTGAQVDGPATAGTTAAPTRAAAPEDDDAETERRRPVSPVVVAAGLVLAVGLVGAVGYVVSSRWLAEVETAAAAPSPPDAARGAAVAAQGAALGTDRSPVPGPAGATPSSGRPPGDDATGAGGALGPEAAPSAPGASGGAAAPAKAAGGDDIRPVSDRSKSAVPKDAAEAAPAAENGAKPTGPAARKAPPPKVEVRLGLGGGVRLAYVRIDRRKVYVLEPFADVRLPAGSHRIEYRFTKDEPWRSGGRIRLEAGRRYKLRVTRSGPQLERR